MGFAADKALAIVGSYPHADSVLLRTLYSKYITEHLDWIKQIEEVCGSPP
ncbi:hypothetical protein XBKQ1_2410012 [Xenorhabdus bovienii str. kraussei Quebec]|uniref:Uncharacterized protein n=1 Tax=Xenorhabdus bovienii str. kraussei Quebec TaxID=1398203 RepID=A0A077P6D7_XENBV|nr:hypothetical protein XBKQ1_2410012 [Xenorhabdus bovienii str. kraussei Quebec]